MSLNCLTCSHVLQRTDSERKYAPEKGCKKVRIQVDRSWSGNISPPECDEVARGEAMAKIKANHRRILSAGNVAYPGSQEPRLVRSSGMRRDRSFENLAEQQDNRVRCHLDH